MNPISYKEFIQLVALRERRNSPQGEKEQQTVREKVLRPDQRILFGQQRRKQLATCPICDALVDADILHPHSGLCPICHEEAQLQG